jgi:hypothetical protein
MRTKSRNSTTSTTGNNLELISECRQLSSRTAGRELFHAAGFVPRGLSGAHGLRRLRAGHRRRTLRGRLHHRPHSKSFRLHLRPGLRRALRGQMPPRGAGRPVSIRALKRFVCEKFGVESDNFDLPRVYPELRDPRRERIGGGRKVAIIGAGPAGLSCAHELALWGFSPTVFEAQNLAGGMLVLGRARISAAARNHPCGNRRD